MQQTLKKFVLDIIRKKQWKKLRDVWAARNAKCVEGCPVSINIPGFIEQIKEGNIEEAYKVIGLVFRTSGYLWSCMSAGDPSVKDSVSAVIKGEAVSIGKLERFVADYALEHDIKPAGSRREERT